MVVTEAGLHEALRAVVDPEIPTCSIVDLGMVHRVDVTPERVTCELLPTFIGCPAKIVIGEEVRKALAAAAGGREVDVRFVLSPPWTADRVTEAGRAALREFGISPDPHRCPYCGAEDTELSSAFGPTPCRSTHFCRSCRNVFEGFKDKGGSGGRQRAERPLSAPQHDPLMETRRGGERQPPGPKGAPR